MLKIQQHVISKDKEIKKQATRVQKGMRETVDLDGLAIKIYGKYLKFLQQKVHEIIDRPPQPVGAAGAGASGASNANINDNVNLNVNENTVNDTMNFNDLQVESSKL